jgi:hypothetical protein
LAVYRRIVEVYTPYVLVGCAMHTQGRRRALQIGTYTLIVSCLEVRTVGRVVPVGRIVEDRLDYIGQDVKNGARGEDWRRGCPDEPLFADLRMWYRATQLNALTWQGRQVLVLHHLAGLTPADLARLLEEPLEEVLVRLDQAEGDLAAWWGERDVRAALARFAADLDVGWMQEVAQGALAYLTERAGR